MLNNIYRIYSISINGGEMYHHLLGTFAVLQNKLHILSDPSSWIKDNIGDGEITKDMNKRLTSYKNSSHIELISEKGVQEGENLALIPEDDAKPNHSHVKTDKKFSVWYYKKTDSNQEHLIEVKRGDFYYNGFKLSEMELKTILDSVRSGAATIRYAIGQKDKIEKMESWIDASLSKTEGDDLEEILSKSSPSFRFSKAGIRQRNVPVVTKPEQMYTKDRANAIAAVDEKTIQDYPVGFKGLENQYTKEQAWDLWNRKAGDWGKIREQEIDKKTKKIQENHERMMFQGSSIYGPTTKINTGYAVGENLKPDNVEYVDSNYDVISIPNEYKDPSAERGTQIHEGFHQTLNDVDMKYGKDSKNHIVNNMISHLEAVDPEAAEAFHQFGHWKVGKYSATKQPEEKMAGVLNYMNDKVTRNQFHKNNYKKMSERHEFANKIHRAYKILFYAGDNAPDEWFKGPVEHKPVQKSIKESDFRSIMKATTEDGKNLVDHTTQLSAHPPSHDSLVKHYQEQVLDHPKNISKSRNAGSGITRKVTYKTKDSDGVEHNWMVKPYHERAISRVKGWQKFPIQGWAEMTNQALYHAGGIGHLHQQVHVGEHQLGDKKEPMLVVHLANGLKSSNLLGNNIDLNTQKDAMKIGLMDFLSNNLDRHGGSYLVGKDEESPFRMTNKILAVDHSRSFQYVSNHGIRKQFKGVSSDSPAAYLGQGLGSDRSSLGYVAGGLFHRHDDSNEVFHNKWEAQKEVFDWWGQSSKHIRDTMYKQLENIKDPEVRAHIKRNFDVRADHLDEMSDMGIDNYGGDWYTNSVEQYPPGVKTEKDKRDEEIQKLRAQEG